MATTIVAVVLTYATFVSLWEAAHRPFWFDEVFTAVLTEMPSFHDVIEALAKSADTSGPGYYVVQRAVSGIGGEPHVFYRLPSILAASLACAILFIFAKRDLGPTAGAIAVFVVLVSQLNHGYSVEARPYALMVLLISLAALAWQRAGSWRWTIVLSATLVSTVAVHYYSIFALGPLGVAEIVRGLRTRERRWRVWAAMMSGGLTLLSLWPMLRALRSYYGGHYWSTPSVGRALATYDTLSGLGASGLGLGVAVAVGVALLVLLERALRGHSKVVEKWPPPETLVLVLGLLGLPIIVSSIAYLMGGGYAGRYALGFIPGLALGVAYVSGALGRRQQAWLLALMVCIFGARELMFWGSGGNAADLRQASATNSQPDMLAKAVALGLPMMVSSGLDYLPLAYYNRNSSVELVGVTDHEAALRFSGTDSVERDLEVLSRYLQLRVETFATFRQANPVFLFLLRPGPFDWWTTHLLAQGHSLTVVHSSGPFLLFRVERSPAATTLN